ncbi:MAG: ShlB/FhaC/HecB family hemolysin secretion/activation protein [Gammaproteobacteria bacterium]
MAPTRIVLPRVVAGAKIPAEAKKLHFVLTGFAVKGEFKDLVAKREALEKPLVGKRISVAQVFEFAAKLQALYVRAGYPLVRVVISPQQLGKAARVNLRVVDGFIERIDASAIDAPARKRVVAVVGGLLNKRHLTQAELERKLLIAGEAPGLVLNATFTAGKKVGGSILVLTGRYRPVSVSLYGDDSMPAVFGTGQAVATASLNGVLGLGEQLTVSAAGLPDKDFTSANPTRRYLTAALQVPIGIDGLFFNGSITNGITTPRVAADAASQGTLTEGYLGLSYQLIKRRDIGLTLSGKLDMTDEEVDTLVLNPAVAISRDRTRVLRGSVDGFWKRPESGTVLSYGATLSQGIDALGARTAADAATTSTPLSRTGADAVFTKLSGHLSVTQSLPKGLFVTLGGYGQTSFNKPLLTSEQYDIVGAQMLSGYDAGSLAGDTAWATRAELGHDFAIPKTTAVLTPYLFAATGERILEQPTTLELGSLHASNLGAGVRLHIAGTKLLPPDFYGFVEGSKQHSDDPTQDGWRIFAGGVISY